MGPGRKLGSPGAKRAGSSGAAAHNHFTAQLRRARGGGDVSVRAKHVRRTALSGGGGVVAAAEPVAAGSGYMHALLRLLPARPPACAPPPPDAAPAAGRRRPGSRGTLRARCPGSSPCEPGRQFGRGGKPAQGERQCLLAYRRVLANSRHLKAQWSPQLALTRRPGRSGRRSASLSTRVAGWAGCMVRLVEFAAQNTPYQSVQLAATRATRCCCGCCTLGPRKQILFWIPGRGALTGAP